jgi:competence protein ComEA
MNHVASSPLQAGRSGSSLPVVTSVRTLPWRAVAKAALSIVAVAGLAWLGASSASRPVPPDAEAVATSASAPAVVSSAPGGEADAGSAVEAKARSLDSEQGILPDGRVVLNAASEQDLRKLPGVGPARAAAIIALRNKLGRFRSPRDLLRVRGIGPKMLRRLEPRLVVDARRPDGPDAGKE